MPQEILIVDVEAFLLKAPLGFPNTFEELGALNIGGALCAPKTDHLLRLLGAKSKGLQLLLLRSSILRSLCGLDARLLRSLCSLDTTCFGDVDPLSASQLCGAGRLHAGGFLSAKALCASQLACLCLLPCKLCGAVLAKHLSCLLERLLRSLSLNTRKTIQKIALR